MAIGVVQPEQRFDCPNCGARADLDRLRENHRGPVPTAHSHDSTMPNWLSGCLRLSLLITGSADDDRCLETPRMRQHYLIDVKVSHTLTALAAVRPDGPGAFMVLALQDHWPTGCSSAMASQRFCRNVHVSAIDNYGAICKAQKPHN